MNRSLVLTYKGLNPINPSLVLKLHQIFEPHEPFLDFKPIKAWTLPQFRTYKGLNPINPFLVLKLQQFFEPHEFFLDFVLIKIWEPHDPCFLKI